MPYVATSSPPPPFALFRSVTCFCTKKNKPVLCRFKSSSYTEKSNSILVLFSYKQTFTFTFLKLLLCVLPSRKTWNKILTEFHNLTIIKELAEFQKSEIIWKILANYKSLKYWQSWKILTKYKSSKVWQHFKILTE